MTKEKPKTLESDWYILGMIVKEARESQCTDGAERTVIKLSPSSVASLERIHTYLESIATQ
jgi:hypothetical protein